MIQRRGRCRLGAQMWFVKSLKSRASSRKTSIKLPARELRIDVGGRNPSLSGESTCYHCYSSVRLRPVPVDLKPLIAVSPSRDMHSDRPSGASPTRRRPLLRSFWCSGADQTARSTGRSVTRDNRRCHRGCTHRLPMNAAHPVPRPLLQCGVSGINHAKLFRGRLASQPLFQNLNQIEVQMSVCRENIGMLMGRPLVAAEIGNATAGLVD